MNAKDINKAIEGVLEERGCFLVETVISADNDIEVAIEKTEGSVDMDDCVAVNDVVLEAFDRDVEDYSLTVTSAGLDQPFQVPAQYAKAVGEKVEVLVRDGRKLVCTLEEATDEAITVGYQVKETVEGKKKKVLVDKHETLSFDNVNSVRYYIDFK